MMGAGYNEAVRRPCSVWVEWCLVVLGLLEVLLGVAIVRPFSVPLDALSVFVMVGLTTLSQLIPLLDASDGASDAADAIGLAASIAQLALLVCAVVDLVSSGTPWRSVQFKKRVDQASTKEENGWQQKVPTTRKKSAVATVTGPDMAQMSVEASDCSRRSLVELVNLICSQRRATDQKLLGLVLPTDT
ncbi:membrane-associated protein, putative [Bodo saltans]|uniref:Membrane-associated protein, putative n=1 Tax=Bodo saltans TaxID=75058 RepID=A0A0S4JAT5_BODSA|nr:membrane-associated protein, putative [Bodo saltans]|eukprot:CUG88584.1 membrane-associated protein, putative [Bodo saltans]